MKDFSVDLQSIDKALRLGQIHVVRSTLAKLGPQSLGRLQPSERIGLGDLCFRANLPELGLKVLEPLVRSKIGEWDRAQPEALIRYGALMQRAGSLIEAESVLRLLDYRAYPKTDLYLAFCLFNRWDYETAIPLLQRYITAESDAYSRLVGEINLASAYVYSGNSTGAEDLLQRSLPKLTSEHVRLRANVFELLATTALQENRLDRAEKWIDQAEGLFPSGVLTPDSLFVLKVRAVLKAMRSNDPAPLMDFRAQARAGRFWESVREAEMYLVRLQPSEEALDRLWFGTPFVGYRRRIERILGRRPSTDHYLLGGKERFEINLRDGRVSGHSGAISGTTLEVVRTLSSDLFSPARPRVLFGRLYPQEHFNPFTSPERVKHAWLRARRAFERAGITLELKRESGRLSFQVSPPFSLKVEDVGERSSPEGRYLSALQSRFSVDVFTAEEAANALAISVSSFKRLAQIFGSSRQIQKIGRARYTVYKLESGSV